jgi:hypothetical protein
MTKFLGRILPTAGIAVAIVLNLLWMAALGYGAARMVGWFLS